MIWIAFTVLLVVLPCIFAEPFSAALHDRVTALAAPRRRPSGKAPIDDVRFIPPFLANIEHDDAELELLDTVIVASVDGRFHALNRTTGDLKWTMTAPSSSEAAPAELAPLVRTMALMDVDDDDSLETYIVEPQTGDIYMLPPHATETASLQKLPVNMEQLVELSPFSLLGDDDRIFIGKKETALLVINLESGQIQSMISSDRECLWKVFDTHTPLQDAQIDLDELDGSKPPRPRRPLEVSIGRTDYTVTVYQKGVGAQQILAYSAYGPNNADRETQQRWKRTPDDRYSLPTPSGDLMTFSTTSDKPLWMLPAFSHPVVAVFDLVSKRGRPDPIGLLQPRPRLSEVFRRGQEHYVENIDRTYVGSVNGSLFAMSAGTYPLVAFSSESPPSRLLIDPPPGEEHLPNTYMCRSGACLTGTWRTSSTSSSRLGRLLPEPSKEEGLPTATASTSPEVSSTSRIGDGHFETPTLSWSGVSVALTSFTAFLFGVCLLWIYIRRRPHPVRAHVVVASSDPANVPAIADAQRDFAAPVPAISIVQSEPKGLDAEEDDVEVPQTQTPTPPPDTREIPLETESDKEDEKLDSAANEKKKRTRKRARNKKGKSAAAADQNGQDPPGEPAVEDQGDGSGDGFVLLDVQPPKGASVVVASPPSPPATPRPAPAPSLVVSETVLGFGSHGTIVYKGAFQGRDVAVKRLLGDFVTLATREVELLQESDDHPNVIRYFYKEHRDNFLYIALELCPASLADVVERPDLHRDISIPFDPKNALSQITAGLRHLHSLKIIHRDIKPQNILVSREKNGVRRMLISDFGLCKKLDSDQTSFAPTMHGAMAAGTVGWRAPEILRGDVKLDDSGSLDPSRERDDMSSRGSAASGNVPTTSKRLTKSVDVFALGCLFYYTLTNGDHPYGDRFEREINIMKNEFSLRELERLGEEGTEATDLIEHMLDPDPRKRPDTYAVLVHPFFWTPARRLGFLQDASDRFEIMCREPRDAALVTLETGAQAVVGHDWHSRLDRMFIENLGKFRKYDGRSVQDLLRAFRNKKHHYQDLPDNVRRHLGPLPDGFLAYFTRRYPRLFLHVHSVVAKTGLDREPMFRSYFELTER